jgi:hypothetical protein
MRRNLIHTFRNLATPMMKALMCAIGKSAVVGGVVVMVVSSQRRTCCDG